ncbi:BTLA protein, partial [Alectura lathami]|nr:BTLA protein [Alectura lathami]
SHVFFLFSLPGFDVSDCPVEIKVQRNSQYKTTIGNFLVIHCPVRYCKERPVMQWCKIEEDGCVLLNDSAAQWESNNFTLEFSLINQNDSGTYHCQAALGTSFSESHGIKVIVEGESPLKSPFKQMDSMYRKAHSC